MTNECCPTLRVGRDSGSPYWSLMFDGHVLDVDGRYYWPSRNELVAALAFKGLGVLNDGYVFVLRPHDD